MLRFPKKMKIRHYLGVFGGSIVLFVIYMHIYTDVFHLELPRTALLQRQNADLQSRARYLTREVQDCSDRLAMLEMRDENVYRPIFGLSSISDGQRQSNVSKSGQYESLSSDVRHGSVRNLVACADTLMQRMYAQTRSYDEIDLMLRTADGMSSCIPSISPVIIEPGGFHITSPFGNRVHPIYGRRIFHKGMDFGGPTGNPVFSTGDGIVESVKIERRGYGRQVIVDHGFGYKTRYAHLKNILVSEGMNVKRGDQIAVSGNSGKSTGPHLHYEVLYKDKPVNPYHYFDVHMEHDQYMQLVKVPEDPEEIYIHPMHRNKK